MRIPPKPGELMPVITLRVPIACILAVSLAGCAPASVSERAEPGEPVDATVPEGAWTRVTRPEDAAWFSIRLREARALSDTLGSAAVMVVHRGVVIDSWGSTAASFPAGGIGRAIVSTLYGARVGDESISAGNAARLMQEDALARLVSAYEAAIGTSVAADFAERIARPLGMQRFDMESFASGAGAAPDFAITPSDLARFGLLQLRRGRWGSVQLLPASWVEATTLSPRRGRGDQRNTVTFGWTPLSTERFPGPVAGRDAYSARGAGGQLLAVLPGHDLVIVHMVDTSAGRSVSFEDIGRIIGIIIRGKPD